MIDTHAHLDACEGPVDQVLARAREEGVARIVAVGSGIDSCRETLAIAERHEGVHAALGIHPHQAGDVDDDDLAELSKLLAHPKAVGIGETGLDYFRDYAPRDKQLELFRRHVDLAGAATETLVVHSRAAEDDTVAVLETVDSEATIVLHCFSSTGLLEPALEHGWYVSFAGNLTYPKASELRWASVQVPRERLLVETDSPYLAPQPVRGRPNEPAHVVHTLAALAKARGEDKDELGRAIDENATRAFGL